MSKAQSETIISSCKHIWQILRPYKKLFFVSSGVSIILVFTQLTQARLTQALIDNISTGKIAKFVIAVAGFFAIIAMTAFLNYLRQVLVAKMSASAVRDLKCSVSEALLHADYAVLNQERSGNAMATLNQDIAAVGNFLNTDLTNLFSQFSMAVGTFIYMLCLEPKLALITFIYMPFGGWFMFRVNKKIEPFFKTCADESGKSLSVVEQVLSQIPVIKSFRMEKQMRERIYRSYQQVYQAEVHVAKWEILMQILGTAALQIPRIVYLGVGGFLVIGGALSIGALVSMMDLLAFIIQPVASLPWLVKGLNATMAAVRRINRLQSLPIEELPEAVCEGKPCIDIRNMTFGYDSKRMLFHEFSFQQNEPGITVLCGGSGTGKTTLLDLIEGLYRPNSGTISVRGKLSVVMQDTYLFADTLLENVRLAKPDATEEDIVEALKQVGAYEFAMKLPQGLDTILGDGNQALSGGQRIGLARTILQDGPIWILDEPTSALDPETEQIILNVIKQQKERKIILISAHRKSLIDLADRKVVL